MKNKLLLATSLLLISAGIRAQSVQHATARIFEAQSKKLSRIVLVYETGESEVIALQAFTFLGVNMDDVLVENQKTINKLINDMAAKGYDVEQMNTTGESFFYSFILFGKKLD